MNYQRHEEDQLPKVIVCGATQENIPKLILCDGNLRRDPCPGSCTPKPCSSLCPRPQLSQRVNNIQQRLNAGNDCLALMQKRIQRDIQKKDQMIENLQQQLCCVQCQMEQLANENAKLCEQIEINEKEAERENKFCMLECKLNEFNYTTTCLESKLKQVECNVKTIRSQLAQVQESDDCCSPPPVPYCYNPYQMPTICGIPPSSK